MIALCFHTFAFALFPFVSPPFLPHTFSLFSCLLYFCSIPARLPAFNYRNRTSPTRKTKSILYFTASSIRFSSISSTADSMSLHSLYYSTELNLKNVGISSGRCLLSNLSKIFSIAYSNYSHQLFRSFLPFVFEAFVVILSLSGEYQILRYQNCFLPLASDILFCITIPARK